MWYILQFLKNLTVIVVMLISLSATANEKREHIQVNFYTLASMQQKLNGQKIGIMGWIYFYEFDDVKKVYLFSSKESRDIFNENDSVEILIPQNKFYDAKRYLAGNVVFVYGIYRTTDVKYKITFGKIVDIDDINIVNIK